MGEKPTWKLIVIWQSKNDFKKVAYFEILF